MMERIAVAVAVIVQSNRVLACRRRDGGLFAGYWEFPGGKVKPGESAEAAVCREVEEELGIQIGVRQALEPTDWDYPRMPIRLLPFICDTAQEPRPIGCALVEWVERSRLVELRFPPANGQLIAQLMRQSEMPRDRDHLDATSGPR